MLSRLALASILLVTASCAADSGLEGEPVPDVSASSLPIVNGEPTTPEFDGWTGTLGTLSP